MDETYPFGIGMAVTPESAAAKTVTAESLILTPNAPFESDRSSSSLASGRYLPECEL
jgi:hypothetical protein